MFKLKNILTVFCAMIFLTTNVMAAPRDECRELLIRDLAENLYTSIEADDAVIISSDSLVEFFTKNIGLCRDYLLAQDEDINHSDINLTVIVNWDYLSEQIAAALSVTANQRNIFICENNRSYQAGIEALLWGGTAVAAVFSFGTGGVAIQGGKTALVQGTKNLTRIGVKKSAKTAAAEAVASKLGKDIVGKTAAKELALKEATAIPLAQAKAAATATFKNYNANATIQATKASLKKQGKGQTTKIIEAELQKTIANPAATAQMRAEATAALNLTAKHQSAIAGRVAATKAAANLTAAEAALIAETSAATKALGGAIARFGISTPIAAAGGIAGVYSFLESGFDPKLMNCTNTNKNSGCYLSCTKDNLGSPNDDLNTKVFKPILGKTLCIDEDTNYVMREIKSGLPTPGDIYTVPNTELMERVKKAIIDNVKDQGKCDWKGDNIDMYIGAPLYDPATFLPMADGSAMPIDGLRIDK